MTSFVDKSTNFRLFPVPIKFVARLHEIVDFRTPNFHGSAILDARALALFTTAEFWIVLPS